MWGSTRVSCRDVPVFVVEEAWSVRNARRHIVTFFHYQLGDVQSLAQKLDLLLNIATRTIDQTKPTRHEAGTLQNSAAWCRTGLRYIRGWAGLRFAQVASATTKRCSAQNPYCDGAIS
eukprot:3606779-Amphidinium_carterae.1